LIFVKQRISTRRIEPNVLGNYLLPWIQNPSFIAAALCVTIGDNLTAMFTYYLKAAVTNPTSDPLLTIPQG